MGAQYESEMVYHSLKEEWEKLGVIFVDTDSGLQKYPELFKEYFATVVPPEDNYFAAVNSAAWSGRLVRVCARGRRNRGALAGLLFD